MLMQCPKLNGRQLFEIYLEIKLEEDGLKVDLCFQNMHTLIDKL